MIRTLEGKTALVTGGAVRIGRALSLALARQGAAVIVHYGSSADEAAQTVAAIRDKGGTAEPLQGDLRDYDTVSGLIARASQKLGTIDILVNSAGIYLPTEVTGTTESDWDEQFAVNLKAPFFLSRYYALHVGKGRSGQIVNIADWRGVRPDTRALAYSLTKACIITMTEGLASALAPNIRVNAIAPGAILPPPGKDESYLEEAARRSPLGKQGSPEDVAEALIYLASAERVTGQVLFVDGGEHLKRTDSTS